MEERRDCENDKLSIANWASFFKFINEAAELVDSKQLVEDHEKLNIFHSTLNNLNAALAYIEIPPKAMVEESEVIGSLIKIIPFLVELNIIASAIRSLSGLLYIVPDKFQDVNSAGLLDNLLDRILSFEMAGSNDEMSVTYYAMDLLDKIYCTTQINKEIIRAPDNISRITQISVKVGQIDEYDGDSTFIQYILNAVINFFNKILREGKEEDIGCVCEFAASAIGCLSPRFFPTIFPLLTRLALKSDMSFLISNDVEIERIIQLSVEDKDENAADLISELVLNWTVNPALKDNCVQLVSRLPIAQYTKIVMEDMDDSESLLRLLGNTVYTCNELPEEFDADPFIEMWSSSISRKPRVSLAFLIVSIWSVIPAPLFFTAFQEEVVEGVLQICIDSSNQLLIFSTKAIANIIKSSIASYNITENAPYLVKFLEDVCDIGEEESAQIATETLDVLSNC